MKKLISLMLVFAVILSLCGGGALHVRADEEGLSASEGRSGRRSSLAVQEAADAETTTASGEDKAAAFAKRGASVTWSLSEDGVLTVSGAGDMTDYAKFEDVPWYSERDNIRSVVIEEGITRVGDGSFGYCHALASVSLPESLTVIGESAFYDCTALTDIAIPGSVTKISYRAFFSCKALPAITIPDSVTDLGDKAFYSCEALTDIVLSASLTSIGAETFAFCRSLPAISLPAGIESIGELAFQSCALTSFAVPENVTFIGSYAFGFCSSLQSLYIPASVTEIGFNPVLSCSMLNTLEVDPANTVYTAADGVLFNKDMTALIGCPDTKTSYTVPDGVTVIETDAFDLCSSLTEISLPDSVTVIGDYAFSECSSLAGVTLPAGLTEIREGAFCAAGLTDITIPAAVTSLGEYVFGECGSLSSVTFEGNAPEIGEDAFCELVLTAYYPAGNETWTADVMLDYEGSVAWVMKLAIPEITGVSMSTNGAALSWTGVPGAETYLLQRGTGSGDWTDLAASAETSYTDAGVKSGDTYVYRVLAGAGDMWSAPGGEQTVLFNPFTDISTSAGKTFRYVSWAYNNGIVTGTSKTTFSPNNPCTRVQFVMMLWKMNGEKTVKGITNPFSDIKDGTKTCKAVLWALKNGIINSGKKFNPNDNISRIQIVMMLWKMAGEIKETGKIPFTDVSGAKTTNAVLWAYNNGITTGTSATTFSPDNNCTRLQLVFFLKNYDEKISGNK